MGERINYFSQKLQTWLNLHIFFFLCGFGSPKWPPLYDIIDIGPYGNMNKRNFSQQRMNNEVNDTSSSEPLVLFNISLCFSTLIYIFIITFYLIFLHLTLELNC